MHNSEWRGLNSFMYMISNEFNVTLLILRGNRPPKFERCTEINHATSEVECPTMWRTTLIFRAVPFIHCG